MQKLILIFLIAFCISACNYFKDEIEHVLPNKIETVSIEKSDYTYTFSKNINKKEVEIKVKSINGTSDTINSLIRIYNDPSLRFINSIDRSVFAKATLFKFQEFSMSSYFTDQLPDPSFIEIKITSRSQITNNPISGAYLGQFVRKNKLDSILEQNNVQVIIDYKGESTFNLNTSYSDQNIEGFTSKDLFFQSNNHGYLSDTIYQDQNNLKVLLRNQSDSSLIDFTLFKQTLQE